MKCEDCLARGVCKSNPMALTVKLLEEYGALLAVLIGLNRAMGADVLRDTLSGFVMGYMSRVVEETESSQVDMGVWGECFTGED